MIILTKILSIITSDINSKKTVNTSLSGLVKQFGLDFALWDRRRFYFMSHKSWETFSTWKSSWLWNHWKCCWICCSANAFVGLIPPLLLLWLCYIWNVCFYKLRHCLIIFIRDHSINSLAIFDEFNLIIVISKLNSDTAIKRCIWYFYL